MYRIGVHIGLGYSLFFRYYLGVGGVTYNGELITYNGQIIKTMADLIAILNDRTATITLPASGNYAVDGSMVAGTAITELTQRGVSVIDANGTPYDNWGFDGGANGTGLTVYSDGTERTIYVVYNL